MGPEFWKPQSSTKLKKCSERKSDACDSTETDGCCAVVACSYCLEFRVYGEDSLYGLAESVAGGWSGEIAGGTFFAYWERGYESGECEFVVTIDGEEVYRKSCYEGQSCRDSSDEAAATIGYDPGTLIWTKVLKRPLEYIIDPVTGCRTWFCGECECSCESLCVTITRDYGGIEIDTGELPDTSYPCDPPVWAGTVGEYSLSLALGRDEYGNCIVTPTVDGVEMAPISGAGCGSVSVTFSLDEYTEVVATCKSCCCDCNEPQPCQCDGRGNPGGATSNPIASSLIVDITSTPSAGSDTCFNGSGTIAFLAAEEGGTDCWTGDITGSCTDCNGSARTWLLNVTVCCVNSLLNEYLVVIRAGTPGVIAVDEQAVTVTAVTCDPFFLDGCIPGTIVGFVVACISGGFNPGTTYSPVCFQIYEAP